jgi:transposase
MTMRALFRLTAGLDVHQKMVVASIARLTDDGTVTFETREFATFRAELRKLAAWLKGQSMQLAIMESTGIYWRAVYEALEEADVTAIVVNAQHVKKVPGRKTDVLDSQWLAELGLYGLLKASFIPSSDLRDLRMITRYRTKLVGSLAGEKNRLHKILESCGIKLGCVVSDIDGVSAQKMIEALIEGKKGPDEIAAMAYGRLRLKADDIRRSLDGKITDRHRFLLRQVQQHIRWLEGQIGKIDEQVLAAMKPYAEEWQLIQTIPGFDEISAAMLLVEIGPDMKQFGSKERLSSWAGICPGNNESAGKKSLHAPPRATGI